LNKNGRSIKEKRSQCSAFVCSFTTVVVFECADCCSISGCEPKLAVLFAQATTVNQEQTNSNQEENSLFNNLLGGGEWETTFTARIESALYVHGQIDAVWWNRVNLEVQAKKAQAKKAKDVVEGEKGEGCRRALHS
jgi:hypothetical protein